LLWILFENLNLKKSLFQDLGSLFSKETLLATNKSVIRITEIAEKVRIHPNSFPSLKPIGSKKQNNFGRGKGQCFPRVSEGGEEIAVVLETPEKIQELQRKLDQKAKQETQTSKASGGR